jgi:hypothetical protein
MAFVPGNDWGTTSARPSALGRVWAREWPLTTREPNRRERSSQAWIVAEGLGFEPRAGLTLRRFSRVRRRD